MVLKEDRIIDEYNQIKVRWAIIFFGGSLLILGTFLKIINTSYLYNIIFILSYLFINTFLFIHLKFKADSKVRIYIGAFTDILAISIIIFYTYGTKSILFPMYILIILSYGVRYGRNIILFSLFFATCFYTTIFTYEMKSNIPKFHFDIEEFLLPEFFKLIILFGITFYISIFSEYIDDTKKDIRNLINKIRNIIKIEHLPIYNDNKEKNEVEEVLILVNNVIQELHRTKEEKERLARNFNELTQTLELKVEERTEELRKKNIELKKANEELKELDNLKENFIATMSHELRTPLTAIIGYSDLLLSGMVGSSTREQKEFIEAIKEKGEHLLYIINGVLDLSKIRVGKIDLFKEEIDINKIIDLSISTIQLQAEKKHIKIIKKIDNNIPKIFVDKSKIRQVLDNILSNSIKFTPEGGNVTIFARSVKEEDNENKENKNYVEVAVADTGIGIPQDQLEKIFDRFYQVDSSFTREHEGAGLGLSIVKSFVEIHDGKVWVESKLGKGSVFKFRIPGS